MERHIYHLPESCLSHVISLTSPLDACRCQAVSAFFRAAAVSDTVWERFLPSEYPPILSHPVRSESKRELYFRLCDSVLTDNGTEENYTRLWLEKRSGAKCYILSAKKLSLSWDDDGDYCWRWIPHPLSRFAEVAELMDCTCLDIHAKIQSKALSPRINYAAYLIFDTLRGHCGLSFPDQETVVTVGDCVSRHAVCLHPNETEMRKFRSAHLLANKETGAPRCPKPREDGWMEMEMGQFYNDESMNMQIKMSFEIFGWYPKRGLIIEGIEIRPVL